VLFQEALFFASRGNNPEGGHMSDESNPVSFDETTVTGVNQFTQAETVNVDPSKETWNEAWPEPLEATSPAAEDEAQPVVVDDGDEPGEPEDEESQTQV